MAEWVRRLEEARLRQPLMPGQHYLSPPTPTHAFHLLPGAFQYWMTDAIEFDPMTRLFDASPTMGTVADVMDHMVQTGEFPTLRDNQGRWRGAVLGLGPEGTVLGNAHHRLAAALLSGYDRVGLSDVAIDPPSLSRLWEEGPQWRWFWKDEVPGSTEFRREQAEEMFRHLRDPGPPRRQVPPTGDPWDLYDTPPIDPAYLAQPSPTSARATRHALMETVLGEDIARHAGGDVVDDIMGRVRAAGGRARPGLLGGVVGLAAPLVAAPLLERVLPESVKDNRFVRGARALVGL